MDKYIIANINMFDRASPIFIVAPNEDIVQLGAYTVEELPDAIINQAYKNEIYDIKIAGGSKYSLLIEHEIEVREMLKYNNKQIKIEVM